MRVLLMVPYFPPVLNSSARVFFELAEDLSKFGHEVAVLTMIPERYLASREGHYRGRFVHRECVGRIQVWRVKNLPIPTHLPLGRALEHFWMAGIALAVSVQLARQDAVIVYSPPLPLGLTGYILARCWGGVAIINIQDLYPKTVVDLGLLRSRFLIRLAERLETFIDRKVDAITVHSAGNRDYVIGRGASADRVHVVPNWVDLKSLRPGYRQNGWRRRHGFDGAFVVSFAGTMGFAQGLEQVVEVAEELRQYSDILFVLAGDGVFRQSLENEVEKRRLVNVRFLPPQPPEAYVELLQASDGCVVSLHKALRTPVIPGKLQSVMAAGRPAIFCANPASDGRRLVEESGCGFFVAAGDSAALANAVLSLYRSPELVERMGQNGRSYAERNFDREKCTQAYAALLGDLRARKGR